MPQLIVNLPETVDPHMVDQLTAAITRMGGQAMPLPDEAEQGMPGEMPGGAPGAQDPQAMLEQAMAMDENGAMGPVPEGMEQAPPMDRGGAIKRPSQLRRPQPAR